MSNNPPLRFSHNHHLLVVKGCEAEPTCWLLTATKPEPTVQLPC